MGDFNSLSRWPRPTQEKRATFPFRPSECPSVLPAPVLRQLRKGVPLENHG